MLWTRFLASSIAASSIAASSILACFPGFAQQPTADIDVATLSAILYARDLQFDTMRLVYTRVTDEVISNPYEAIWDVPGAIRPDEAALELVGMPIQVRKAEEMILRGSEVTFRSELFDADLEFFKSLPRGFPVPWKFSSHSNVGGEQISFDHDIALSDPNSTKSLMRYPADPYMDIAQEKQLETELAFGYGLGKRLISVESIMPDSSGLRVTGVVRLWDSDVSEFEMVLDDHYIVRDARIVSHMPDGHNIVEITTQGLTKSPSGLEFAREGHFKRSSFELAIHEVTLGTRYTTVADYRVEFVSVETELSDAAYAELSHIEIPEGTLVEDRIKQLSMVYGKPETAQAFQTPKIAEEYMPAVGESIVRSEDLWRSIPPLAALSPPESDTGESVAKRPPNRVIALSGPGREVSEVILIAAAAIGGIGIVLLSFSKRGGRR